MSKITFTASGDALIVKKFPRDYNGLKPIADFLNTADVRLTNLETVISNYESFASAYSGGTWVNARPEILDELLKYGFNGCGCANNHTLDFSYGGLESTIKNLQKRNIPFAGVGFNLQEASSPAYIETPNGKVGMISICSTFNMAAAAGYKTDYLDGRPGLNPLRFSTSYIVTPEHLEVLKTIADNTKMNGSRNNSIKAGFTVPDKEGTFTFGKDKFIAGEVERKQTTPNKKDLERTKLGIEAALEKAEHVIIMAHSHEIRGNEYYEPDEFFEEFCRFCIDCGASAVIGGGTHQLKPIEIYRGKPIFYSLGDFIFQNNYVEILPSDFMEKYNVDYNSPTEVGLNARSRGGKVGLDKDINNYLSVIPRFTFEDKKLVSLELLPIELGFEFDEQYKGLPYIADNITGNSICEILKTISSPYNTKMRYENGLIKVEI